MHKFLKFNGKIDRRSPRNENFEDSVYMRENLLARDGALKRPRGTTRAISTTLTGTPSWMGRYYTVETGQQSPKTFIYTSDGKLWVISGETATVVKEGLNLNAYPRSWVFKTQTQSKMYLVDGLNLYKYDGNNDNSWELVTLADTDGNSIYPIDLIEHKDRLILISETFIYISKNLEPDNFNDATDSIQIIVGSGKGKNKALGKIIDSLYIFTTEGIWVLSGDVISAVASTFELRQISPKRIAAGRTAVPVEGGIIFLADDYNLYSFTGGPNPEKLTHDVKLEDFINQATELVNKAVATYEDNYYKLSFVENTEVHNRQELWWDAFDKRCDFVRGRNVAFYMQSDPTREDLFFQFGRSDMGMIMWADRGYNFDSVAIRSRLWTKDILFSKYENARIVAFYPELEPHGYQNITIAYLLDGRLDGLSPASRWTQNLMGEGSQLGQIIITNQTQFSDRIRPKINYAKGRSIAFYIDDSTMNMEFGLMGMGLEWVGKGLKKGKKVGQ